MRTIAILGGGISGLTLAYFLKEKFGSKLNVTLFEKSDRPGGWLRTLRKGGFQFEAGPRSLRVQGKGAMTLSLAKQLGLEDQIVFADLNAKRRFILRDGKLDPLPQTFLELLTTASGRLILKSFIKEPFQKKGTQSDETIHDFFRRRFGKKLANEFVHPFVTGIFGGDSHSLSLKACFPKFHELEKKYSSLLLGLIFDKKKSAKSEAVSPMFSFKNGIETLPFKIYEKIKPHCEMKKEIQAIEKKGSHFVLHFDNGQTFIADKVVSTLPLYESLKLLSSNYKEFKDFEAFKTPYASIIQVCLGWKKKVLSKNGFGYLVSPSESHEKILGAVFDSAAFPAQNKMADETRITFMLGGLKNKELLDFSSDSLLKIAQNALKSHLEIDEPFDEHLIYKAKDAIPQYELGYLDRINELQEKIDCKLPGFLFAGTAIHGVSVNDCISASKKLSETIE